MLLSGSEDATILLVVEPPSRRLYDAGDVMRADVATYLSRKMEQCGLDTNEVAILTCSTPPPEDCVTDSKINKHVASERAQFVEALSGAMATGNIKLIIPMGSQAIRQLSGDATKITSVRGKFTTYRDSGDTIVFPTLSASNVLKRPDVEPTLESDLRLVGKLKNCEWDMQTLDASRPVTRYRWITDLSPLLRRTESIVAIDTETVGLRWWTADFRVLCASISMREGEAYVVPLDCDYYPALTKPQRSVLIGQLKELCASRHRYFVGHNLKFDLHALCTLGIVVHNWWVDTIQLVFCADENMLQKNLDDSIKRWVNEMAGYADAFNADPVHKDKSAMHLVPHDKMLMYAGGDADATYRLAAVLVDEVSRDERQWNAFMRVQMPALRAFYRMEKRGTLVHKENLRALGVSLAEKERELYAELINMVPDPVLLRHEGQWNFNRADFVADILFSADGFGLTPLMFTDSTKDGPPEKRKPSVSAKTHLALLDEHEFVSRYIEYRKVEKMRSTYVGAEGGVVYTEVPVGRSGNYTGNAAKAMKLLSASSTSKERIRVRKYSNPVEVGNKTYVLQKGTGALFVREYTPHTGFWKYMDDEGVIRPSLVLDRTVTGRAASRNPNSQNWPKRGALADAYRRVFIPRDGYVWLELDLSQAEVRIAAAMSNERKMIDIYRNNGDIHCYTAASNMGINISVFLDGYSGSGKTRLLCNEVTAWPGAREYLASYPPDKRNALTVSKFLEFKRYQAKASVFGFIYGMGWRKFKDYAKTDYRITYTEDEAQSMRTRFFQAYPALVRWHTDMREFVKEHGFVRALHGAKRSLPSVASMDQGIQRSAERMAINSPVQRMASDIGLIGLARFCRDCPSEDMIPSGFIHDAIVMEVVESRRDEAASALRWYMQNPPLREWFNLSLPVPIIADAKWGNTLADMQDLHVDAVRPDWYGNGLPPEDATDAELDCIVTDH